jgi:hypothetical protein
VSVGIVLDSRQKQGVGGCTNLVQLSMRFAESTMIYRRTAKLDHCFKYAVADTAKLSYAEQACLA